MRRRVHELCQRVPGNGNLSPAPAASVRPRRSAVGAVAARLQGQARVQLTNVDCRRVAARADTEIVGAGCNPRPLSKALPHANDILTRTNPGAQCGRAGGGRCAAHRSGVGIAADAGPASDRHRLAATGGRSASTAEGASACSAATARMARAAAASAVFRAAAGNPHSATSRAIANHQSAEGRAATRAGGDRAAACPGASRARTAGGRAGGTTGAAATEASAATAATGASATTRSIATGAAGGIAVRPAGISASGDTRRGHRHDTHLLPGRRGGRVIDARVLKRSGPLREHRLLDSAAVDALSRCGFSGGLDARGRPTGGFATVNYAWTLE